MTNELVKMKDMDVMEQNFCNSPIMTVKLKSNDKIYVGVKWITTALGFNKNIHDRLVKNIQSDIVLSQGASFLTLPTNGGNQKSLCIELDYLPLWLAKISITPTLKQNNPEIVQKLVLFQLKAKDILASAFINKTNDWNLHREVGKKDRKRMTSSISQNIRDAQSKTYSEYTNMVYVVLFGMTAKELRESRSLTKQSQLTRDYLTEEELKLIDEAETIVAALVSLGFKKEYILDQLRRKYIKKLESSI